jgi:hypothetical protein
MRGTPSTSSEFPQITLTRDGSVIGESPTTCSEIGPPLDRPLSAHHGATLPATDDEPCHDHPVVPDDFFEAGDLRLLEKIDGSSFRFTLYDERYASHYPEQVRDAAAGGGSLVFGTRRAIRGSHRDPLDEIDGALHRAVRALRAGVDESALRSVHDAYGSPLVVYAENLVYSPLDYGYADRTLPALIGFGVVPYDAIETMTPPGTC